jgi:adenosylcobinamide-GDP ribazoletransferase
MKALIASLQFITAIPLGRPQSFDPKGIIVSFPLAGLVVGLFLATFDAVVSLLWSLQIASALDVVFLAALTGALHLDGLADTADGLYGMREQEKSLAIMKDSRVGAMGLVTVVCVLLLKAVSLGHLEHYRFLALIVVPAYARSTMMVGMRFLPYARGREGTGSAFFETPLKLKDFRWALLPFLLSLLLGWRGILLNLSCAVVWMALFLLYRRKIGGITGDMLGCMVEVMEAALFLALALGGGR